MHLLMWIHSILWCPIECTTACTQILKHKSNNIIGLNLEGCLHTSTHTFTHLFHKTMKSNKQKIVTFQCKRPLYHLSYVYMYTQYYDRIHFSNEKVLGSIWITYQLKLVVKPKIWIKVTCIKWNALTKQSTWPWNSKHEKQNLSSTDD